MAANLELRRRFEQPPKITLFISGFNVQDLVREDILYKNVKSHLAGTRLGMKLKFEAQTFEFDIFLWLKDLLLF